MMSTRMSSFAYIVATMVLTGLLPGCASTSGSYYTGWWPGTRHVETPPATQMDQAYRDAALQAQYGRENPGTSGDCSRGSCCGSGSCSVGGSCCGGRSSSGGGSCCSGGPPRTSLAAAPATMQSNQPYGNSMTENQSTQPSGSAPSPTGGSFGGQKTCPVTGEALGSMGPPVPVTVKGQTIYVCCAGCVDTVQRDPDVYLAKVMRERTGG